VIRIVGIGREGDTVVFEVEFDFRGETHRLTIKKTIDEILQFESKEAFIDYIKKVVNNKRTEMFADLADEYVPLNEDLEAEEESA